MGTLRYAVECRSHTPLSEFDEEAVNYRKDSLKHQPAHLALHRATVGELKEHISHCTNKVYVTCRLREALKTAFSHATGCSLVYTALTHEYVDEEDATQEKNIPEVPRHRKRTYKAMCKQIPDSEKLLLKKESVNF